LKDNGLSNQLSFWGWSNYSNLSQSRSQYDCQTVLVSLLSSSLDLIGIKQHKITTINEDQLKDYGRNLNKIKESRSLASLGEGGDSVRFGVNSKVMQNLLCQNY